MPLFQLSGPISCDSPHAIVFIRHYHRYLPHVHNAVFPQLPANQFTTAAARLSGMHQGHGWSLQVCSLGGIVLPPVLERSASAHFHSESLALPHFLSSCPRRKGIQVGLTVCTLIPPSTSFQVCLSSPTFPEQKIVPPPTTAYENTGVGAGACSVRISLLDIIVRKGKRPTREIN